MPICNLFLRRHNVFNGVGVIAGRDYKKGEIIENVPGIVIPLNDSSQTILDYYTSAHIPDYDNIIFGWMHMCNHHRHNSAIFQPPNEMKIKRKGFVGSHLRFTLLAVRDISKGSEIHVSYGTNEWFKQRGIVQLKPPKKGAPPKYPLLPGCVRSTIHEHRGRMYTSRPIKIGEVIEVSRALILPANRAVNRSLQPYVYFRQNATELKGAVLLLGNGALYQPPASGKFSDSNLNYTWFNEEAYSLSNSSNVDRRFDDAISEIQCDLAMFIVFRASRDIMMNEELTIAIQETQYGGMPFRQTLDHMLDPRCFS